jgi:thiol:disulfide interchange protein DsbD
MLLKNCYKLLSPVMALMPLAAVLLAQTSPNLTVAPVPTVKVRKGSVAAVTLRAVLPPGFHANSNTPSDEYLIPLTLKWTGGPLQTDAVTYPKGTLEKYPFSAKPLSVVTGEFSISTKFKVPADATNGAAAQNGVLKYQACNDRMCFAPKTVPVSLTLEIE